MERICKNCRLFNENDNVCGVTVVISGESYELPVLPYDSCHWERVDKEIQSELKDQIKNHEEPYFKSKLESELDSKVEIQQMRMWSDGKNGYIETPKYQHPSA